MKQHSNSSPRLLGLKLLWVIPNKLVDVFWGEGWENHTRIRVTKGNMTFLFGSRMPIPVKLELFDQMRKLD